VSERPTHCDQPMVWFTVGAPGVGSGWWCERCNHTVYVQRPRILRPDETR
jgi:hypothetical protein